MVNSYYSKTKAELKFKKRFNKSVDQDHSEIENESKDKFILNRNQLFVLDTLEKTEINDLSKDKITKTDRVNLDESLFNYKNFDRELVKLGLTEGPNIDLSKLSPEDVKQRRQALEEK